MKIYLTYGLAIALWKAMATIIWYCLGFHSDPAKIQTAESLALPVGLVIIGATTALGMRAKRNVTPITEEFSYERAFGTGFMIVLFAAILSAIFNYIYVNFINPDFNEILLQARGARLEARGLSSEHIERTLNRARILMKPGIQFVFDIVRALIVGTIVSFIIAAFVKRPVVASTPATEA